MKKDTIKFVAIICLIFISSCVLGNYLTWKEGIHQAGELTSEALEFALVVSFISMFLIISYKQKENGMRTCNKLSKDNYFLSLLKETPLKHLARKGNLDLDKDTSNSIFENEISSGVDPEISAIVCTQSDGKMESAKNSMQINNEKMLFNRSLRPESTSDDNIDTSFSDNTIEELKKYDISLKMLQKSFNYYDRSIFKETLNPFDKKDREMLRWEEISVLNYFGLIHQDNVFPYLIHIDMNPNNILTAKTMIWFEHNKKLHIPDMKNIDNLNNGYEFIDYIANLLDCIGFENIEKLSNYDKNGIDMIATKDGIRYGFRCVYSSNKVGVSKLKETITGTNYHIARVPVVVTNSKFNSNAKKYADLYNVQLWDFEKIAFEFLEGKPE